MSSLEFHLPMSLVSWVPLSSFTSCFGGAHHWIVSSDWKDSAMSESLIMTKSAFLSLVFQWGLIALYACSTAVILDSPFTSILEIPFTYYLCSSSVFYSPHFLLSWFIPLVREHLSSSGFPRIVHEGCFFLYIYLLCLKMSLFHSHT